MDLSAATFLDSSILGALLEARRQALEKTVGLRRLPRGPPEPGVQRILEITGLVPVLPVVRSARRRSRRRARRGSGRMTEEPVVRLELPARPEGVGVVRQALVGVADGLAIDARCSPTPRWR